MEAISVIVPVYRVEAYLCRCVDSILNQTYENLELILVDDGSPDGSPAICDDYAGRDSRVHVIHQENQGLSAARNAGIDYVLAHSASRWLTFVDSDDWLHPQMLERLLQAAKEFQTQVSICGYEETTGESPLLLPEDLTASVWQVGEHYQKETVLLTIACGKLYSRDCFSEIRYPVGMLHEDEFTTYRILFRQGEIACVPAPMYAYFINPGSITKSSWNPRRLDIWQAFEEQIRFFEDRGQRELAEFCRGRYLRNAWIQLQQLEKQEDAQALSRYAPRLREKIRALLPKVKRAGGLDFERDYSLLSRFEPVKTRLRLYGKALRRRLRGLQCRK